MDWLTDTKIPIGKWAKGFVDFLTDNGAWFFDGLAFALENFIEALLFLLQLPHPFLMAIVVAALAWVLRRSIGFALFVFLGILLIVNQGYWEETTETLALVLAATMVCMAIGIPVGILAARRPVFYAAIRPVLDLMQTIPTFVYLIPALILFGLGMVPGLIATVVFALPASIRLTQLGISETPDELKEAGSAFGGNSWQILWKIEIPSALPQIRLG
nr:ABC transporter permease subunit [Sneathiella glossodoripedis]